MWEALYVEEIRIPGSSKEVQLFTILQTPLELD